MSLSRPIEQREVRTLEQFYGLMAETRELRACVVHELFNGGAVDPESIRSLSRALKSLERMPGPAGAKVLELGPAAAITIDPGYETKELEKDIFFLKHGREKFLFYLEELHPDFQTHVQNGLNLLRDVKFNCFITDRDGTVNNYCGRYRSSVQSIYNALFLSSFAKERTRFSIIMTSAPLMDFGVVDLSVSPENIFVYAASKGREFLDPSGARRTFPIDARKQARLDELNKRLQRMTQGPGRSRFTLIGSGLQFKFGQTTIARQDISGSIPAPESLEFLAEIKELVSELDPQEKNFRIEDTGLDVEIILTIGDEEGGLKDFDKADGVLYLDRAMGLHMEQGPHLVCGDTSSDAPMIEAAMKRSGDARTIFVTRKEDLAARVSGMAPETVIAPEPDMLVAALGLAAEESRPRG